MSSSENNEGQIRAAMVDADVVEVMIALPGQLFFNTQIPACLWFLAKGKRSRGGEVLFIDARKLAVMISRVQCELTDEVIDRIACTVAAWRGDVGAGDYADVAGYCRSMKLAEIAEHGHVLTPGRYVGAEAVEDNDEDFAAKMQTLTEKLGEQMAKGAELDAVIRAKLGGWAMNFDEAFVQALLALPTVLGGRAWMGAPDSGVIDSRMRSSDLQSLVGESSRVKSLGSGLTRATAHAGARRAGYIGGADLTQGVHQETQYVANL